MTDSYTYPATSNRLSSITLGAGGSRPFTYDGAGNVITDTRSGTVYGYTYNSAGRLSALSVGGVATATYRYDAMGRQVTRTLVPSGVTIHSVFDSQGRRIAEYNEATGAIIREYVWMGWEPVAVIEGGVVYLIRADHIGRPSFATTLAGTKVWSAVYLPFGGVHVTTGAPIDARFPGQWFQTEAGLYQNWMRDYDPTTGRYIEADPLGLVDGASVYGYAGQSPLMYTDPRGECVGPLAIACAAAVGAAVNVAFGYLIDQVIGDGCYSWQEAGLDAAVGAAFGPWGRAWGFAGNAWKFGRYGDDASRSAFAAFVSRAAKQQGHHPIPKFMGGNTKQALTPLAPRIHNGAGGFHSQLNQALRSAFGRAGGGRGGSADDWARYFRNNPGEQRRAFDILLDVSRSFDAANGASVTSGVWNSIISGAFRTYP